jgi:hypothetical protein
MTKRRRTVGLFANGNGWWRDMSGNKIEQIWKREEWAEIYRLYALGIQLGLQVEQRPTKEVS